MTATPLPVIPAVSAEILEAALKTYLDLDPGHRKFLAPMAGKIIAFRIRHFGATLYFCPTETSLQVLSEIEGTADVVLLGSVPAFARMGLGEAAQEALTAGGIELEGDADTARRFRDLFERLNIDWEAHLGRSVGTGFASSISEFIATGNAWVHDTVKALRADLAEYWQEESGALPAGPEVEIFLTAVDTLRADQDRLETRIRRLEDQLRESRVSATAPIP